MAKNIQSNRKDQFCFATVEQQLVANFHKLLVFFFFISLRIMIATSFTKSF